MVGAGRRVRGRGGGAGPSSPAPSLDRDADDSLMSSFDLMSSRPLPESPTPARPKAAAHAVEARAPFGNYHDYRHKRHIFSSQPHPQSQPQSQEQQKTASQQHATPALDPRIALLPAHIFKNARVLDVGCNAGDIAIAVALFLHPRSVHGIDIDPALIRKANASVAHWESRRRGDDASYFPLSCHQNLGPMPFVKAPTSSNDGSDDPLMATFPANITFRASNFVTQPLPPPSSPKYDVVLALSITKWIHLNHGDSGLRLFFQKCFNSLRRGGTLILEPQEFGKGYGRAKRSAIIEEEVPNAAQQVRENGGGGHSAMDVDGDDNDNGPPHKEKTTSNGSKMDLAISPDMFQDVLITEIGFSSVEMLGEAESQVKGFRRKIYAYKK